MQATVLDRYSMAAFSIGSMPYKVIFGGAEAGYVLRRLIAH